MAQKKDDLKPEDEKPEDDVLDPEDQKEDEEPQDDNADEDPKDPKDDEELGDVINIEAYKGLQRTLNKKQSELDAAQKKYDDLQTEFDEFRSTMDADKIVRGDLQKALAEQRQRLDALEQENKLAKVDAMQSQLILEDFPSLARFKEYIPSAETPEEYRKNLEQFQSVLGDKVNEALDEELSGSTPPVDDDESKKPTQAQIDKAHEKAMSLAGKGDLDAYNKAMDEYMDLLAKVNPQ